VHPALVATVLGDGGEAGVSLDFGRALITLALLAEGGESPRGVDGSGARQGTEQRIVGQRGGKWRDLQVEAADGLEHGPSRLDEDLDQQPVGADHPGIKGKWGGLEDGLEALLDDVGIAHVVLMEEGCQAGFACLLGLLKRGPAGENVTKDHGVLVLEPLQDLGEIRRERVGEPIREAHLVSHQGAALLHQTLQGAHGNALRMQGGQPVVVGHQKFER
jgi:hypothetical protein